MIHPMLDMWSDCLDFSIDWTLEETQEFYSTEIVKGKIVDWSFLDHPSGLGEILLMTGFGYPSNKYRKVDFTGTSVRQALEKLYVFYKHKTFNKEIGDHRFFQGFYTNKKGYIIISLGS